MSETSERISPRKMFCPRVLLKSFPEHNLEDTGTQREKISYNRSVQPHVKTVKTQGNNQFQIQVDKKKKNQNASSLYIVTDAKDWSKKSYPLKFELNLGSSTNEKNLVMKAQNKCIAQHGNERFKRQYVHSTYRQKLMYIADYYLKQKHAYKSISFQ